MATKTQVLQVYRALIRESKKWPAYNFRMYALRKIRDSFKENKGLTDGAAIAAKMQEARQNLEVIKRQVVISQMYSTDRLVIENIAGKRTTAST